MRAARRFAWGAAGAATIASTLVVVAPVTAQAGEVVVDRVGVPVKLITTRDTRIYEQPDRTSRSSPARLFQFWYVLPPDPAGDSRVLEEMASATRDGFYRVASSIQRKSEQGWLSQDDAVVWSHRQAVRPAGRRAGRPVSFFASREDALAALRTGDDRAATHREPADGGSLLLPILSAEEVDVGGDRTQLYQVAFVSGTRAPVAGVPTRSEVASRITLDLVFVVDTTASMSNPIAQVRRSVARVVDDLSRRPGLGPRLRLGLVGYRDSRNGGAAPELEYVARIFCSLSEGADHQRFLRSLSALEVSTRSSEDYAEDVLAGLDRALSAEMGWNPMAWKQVVVVGDSSAKMADHPVEASRLNEGGRTLATIAERAQRGDAEGSTAVVLSVVRVKDPSFTDDHPIGDRQFNILVSGADYNGYVVSARGGASPEDFSSELTRRLLTGLEWFESTVVRGETGGAVPTGLSAAEYPYPVLDLIRSLPDEPASSDGSPRFATRYCTDLDADGSRVLVPHVLVREPQMRMFVAFVDFLITALEEAGEPGARDLEVVLAQLQAVTLSINLDEPLRAESRIDAVLAKIIDLPVRSGVFELTLQDLAVMSAARWKDFVRSVGASREALSELLDNAHTWFELHENSGDRHAFVPITDLP